LSSAEQFASKVAVDRQRFFVSPSLPRFNNFVGFVDRFQPGGWNAIDAVGLCSNRYFIVGDDRMIWATCPSPEQRRLFRGRTPPRRAGNRDIITTPPTNFRESVN
jgi:hypothetical protein